MTDHLTSVDEYRRLVAGATSEEELLVDVAQRLTLGRWRWHHVRRADLAQQQGDPGFPDLIAIRDDILVVAELKTTKGRYGTGQVDWLKAFERVQFVAARTWRPGDADAIAELLR